MKILIFFGAPGAGKGTQAKKLSEKFNLRHVSTGDLLRLQIERKTELGLKAKLFMDKGDLVPDDVMIGMVKNTINQTKDVKGIILDGFPRTLHQAEELDIVLAKNNHCISNVLFINVNKQEIIDRLQKRAEIENRKDDSDISIVENRISVYNQKTAPVVGYYEQQNKLKRIEGVGEIDDIFERIQNTLCLI
ncbi:MAG: adenylate kinase [Bacteroidales bacterium]|nr:adenylate kinase [Bacteroidales bacterium]